jgi:lipopolysaccharide heptosyltransferase I
VSAAPRILIVKPSSLGDVVHALPTVARIRRRFPDAHIAWLVNDNLASLLAHCPLINELIPFHRQQPSRFLALLRQLRAGRFDIVVDLQGLFRSGIMTFATRAPRRIGLSDAREGSRAFYNETVPLARQHAVDRYLKAAEHLGCPDAPIEFPLGVASAPREGWMAVNPSARWPTKLWGDDRFAELIRQLPRERVVLTGGASERDRIERIAQGCRNKAGTTDLFQLAEFYARCSVVVTNDSGPMHIAAAVGTPVIAIFGPTDPALTGPYGKQHIVLRAGVDCSPCLKDRCVHQPPMECMEKVTVEEVLAAIASLSAGLGAARCRRLEDGSHR